MKNGLVSVIIVNWNSLNFINSLLNSLKSQTYRNLELILYDNGSSDGSLEYIIQHCPRINILSNSKNIGFSKAVNSCLEKSKGEYILVLNTDIIMEPNFIEEMINAIGLDPKIGSASGKIFKLKDGRKTDKPDVFSHFMRKNRTVMHLSCGEPNHRSYLYNKIRFCFGTPACAGIYRREMLRDIKVGNEVFDEDFFAYWEDVDVDWRALLRGWRCIYTPKAVAYHAREGSGLKKNAKIAAGHLANKFFVIIKNDSVLSVLKDSHLILIKTVREWLSFAKKNILIIFFATFKVILLSNKMLKKRMVIQKNKTISHKDIKIWFEDESAFPEFKKIVHDLINKFKKFMIGFISSSIYREIGFWRTSIYCTIALILFFINKIILICFIRLLNLAGLFRERSYPPDDSERINDQALVIPVMPDISHHFVYREVEELLKRRNYEVIVITKGEEKYKSESIKPLLGRATYLQDVSDTRFLGLLSLLYYQLKSPHRIVKLFNYYKKHGKNKREKNPLNISLFWDPCNPIRGFALANYLERRGISYVHVFGSSTPGTQMLISHLFLNIPFSITAYQDFDYGYPYKMLEEKLFYSEFFVVTTSFCKDRLNGYFQNNYSKKVFIIQSALDLDRFIFDAEVKINGKIKILAVGRLVEKKGFEYLIDACKILKDDYNSNFTCSIVGDGYLKRALLKKIKRNNLSDIVKLVGGISIDEVKNFYKKSTLLVHPGIETDGGDRDGIPNSIIEAMAVGLPVVASKISGIPELISDGINAILVPERDAMALAEAIEKIMSSEEIRKVFVRNGRKRIEEFANVKKTTKTLYSLLKDCSHK